MTIAYLHLESSTQEMNKARNLQVLRLLRQGTAVTKLFETIWRKPLDNMSPLKLTVFELVFRFFHSHFFQFIESVHNEILFAFCHPKCLSKYLFVYMNVGDPPYLSVRYRFEFDPFLHFRVFYFSGCQLKFWAQFKWMLSLEKQNKNKII